MDRANQGQGAAPQAPVTVVDWRSGQSVQSLEPMYLLSEVNFERLKGGPLRTETFAVNLLFAWVAYLLTLLPRSIDHLRDSTKDGPTSSEWLICWVGIAVIVVIWGSGFLFQSPRKKTLKKIEEFFEANEVAGGSSAGRRGQ